jgi:hypothetical protein
LAREKLAAARQVIVGCQLTVSPALAAAQQKLERLRLAHRPDQNLRPTPTIVQVGRFQSPRYSNPNALQTRPKCLPAHLGWNSAPVTKAYRLAMKNQARQAGNDTPAIPPAPPALLAPLATAAPTISELSLKLSPDIALAILRKKLASPGRIWLLLRHIDDEGRGWVSAEMARKRLTGKKSDAAVCSGRHLRNLLAAGDGIFWRRDGERIWLKSMAKVAAVLGLSRLNGRAVRLPVSILFESIGSVRAHLYAALHSSRSGQSGGGDARNDNQSQPISRTTLKALSSATRRTQRLYEKRVGIKRQCNYAIGPVHTAEGEQNLAWQKGQAAFRFNDKKGFVGKSGQQYLAWQLPNSYEGPHSTLSKSYQRRINRQLADLLNEGITGNGEKKAGNSAEKTIDNAEMAFRTPIFYRNGSTAAKVYNRTPDQALYWRSRLQHRRFSLWHSLPAISRKNRQ